jgi:hypothetical protein
MLAYVSLIPYVSLITVKGPGERIAAMVIISSSLSHQFLFLNKPTIMNTSFYSVMLHVHSVGRWIILILLLIAIFNSMVAGRRPYIRTDARTGLILTIFADIMLLVGLYQWFAGPWGYKMIQARGFSEVMKDPTARFYAIEHLAGMLIAIILIHVGKAQGRKHISDKAKHTRTLIFYTLALLIILASIPWPFRGIGAGRGWY